MRLKTIKIIVLTVLLVSSLSYAGYRELFEKEFLLADWAGIQEKSSACVACHSSENMDQDMLNLVQDWRQSWHAANDVSCHDCHGGAPEDASDSMSHNRGFRGVPTTDQIPDLCGTCHIAILRNYTESGHGKSICEVPTGPTCVTCHGSHNIKQASIDIINEKRCSQCHSYERARLMKQALYEMENKLTTIRTDLKELRLAGLPLQDQEKNFFRAHSEFRTVFHTIDIELVKEKSNEFLEKLSPIEAEIKSATDRLAFRRNFSAFLLLIFAGMAGVVYLLIRSDK